MRRQQPGEKTPAGALICDGQYNAMRGYLSRYARQIVPALEGDALPGIDNARQTARLNPLNTHGLVGHTTRRPQESHKACPALNAYLLQTSGTFPGGGLQNLFS